EFGIGEDESYSEIIFRTYAFSRSGAKKAKKKNKLRFSRYYFERKTRLKYIRKIYDFFLKFKPKKKPLILFSSEARMRLEGNLLAVYERALERGLDKQYRLEVHTAIPGKRSVLYRAKQIKLL